MEDYKQLITLADRSEYLRHYSEAIKFLKAALKVKQNGSVSKKDIELRIAELELK